MTQPKFEVGQLVYKWTGDYTGPGTVRGVVANRKGQTRYMVGHTVDGGEGEFLHIYAEGNLREVNVNDGDLPTMHDVKGILPRPETTGNELLEALATAHRQVDMLMALVIGLDKSFMPSKTSLWPDIVARVELIRKYEGTL